MKKITPDPPVSPLNAADSMHVGTGGSITMFPEKHDQLFSREEAPITPRT